MKCRLGFGNTRIIQAERLERINGFVCSNCGFAAQMKQVVVVQGQAVGGRGLVQGFYSICVICSGEHVSLKRKMRRLRSRRIFRSRSADGREVILAPIIGKDGKVHRFIVLDKNDPLPIPRQETETYLRAD
jgi:hypothetical protein